MSDFVRAEWADWTDRVIYVEKHTGEEIVELYNQMNNSNDKHITATQVFPIQTLPPNPMLFNCLIYYKFKYGSVKGI